MSITVLSNENFEKEVLAAEKPVLVDFFATWCMPCKMLSPTIEEIADEHDEIKVCKADVDECEELARAFNIMSVPTLLAFKNGENTSEQIGLVDKQTILEMF